MSLTENPVSTVLDNESITVPEGETWRVTISSDSANEIVINQISLSRDTDDVGDQIETVLTEGDTVEGTLHIGGFAL